MQARSKEPTGGTRKPLRRLFDDRTPVDPVRRRTLSRIRGKDTGPEMEVGRLLWDQGLRYRVHDPSLPGTPDISNKSRNVAVFIDGCFGHGCPRHHSLATRAEFWDEKIRRNQEKRRVVRAQYRAAGGPSSSSNARPRSSMRRPVRRAMNITG